MVDPNRKINRLTDKDVEFLEECELEFAMRYTESDADFMDHCLKSFDDPPIIENFNTSDFSGGDGGGRNYNRFGNRNWRNNFRSRGAGRDRSDDRGGAHSFDKPYKRPAFKQEENIAYSPVNIKSNYINFVAASKDD